MGVALATCLAPTGLRSCGTRWETAAQPATTGRSRRRRRSRSPTKHGSRGRRCTGNVHRGKRRGMAHDRADVLRDAIGLFSETAAIRASRPGTRRRAPGADAARAGTLTVAHSPPAQAHRAGRPVADSLLVAARCAPPSPTTRHGVLPARPKVAELKCIATFITQHLRRRLVRYGGARSGAGPVRRSPGVLAAKITDHVPPSWSGGRGRSPSPARGRRSWPGSCCWPSRGTTPTQTCCRARPRAARATSRDTQTAQEKACPVLSC
jgi:hypothetical protein